MDNLRYKEISPVFKLTYKFDFTKCNEDSLIEVLYRTIE